MIKAFIFDMDGVIVDNHHYHVIAWKQFCQEIDVDFDENEFRKKYFGKNNHDILTGLMNKQLTPIMVSELGERKEALYRQVYQDHIKMVDGLEELLKKIAQKGKLSAVATSAPISNLDFVIDRLKLRKYYHCLSNGDQVKRAKPDPEIYIKTAKKLGVEPHECVVFEDSVSGIMAAKNAGMTVIALLTTHLRDELPEAELFINNFYDKRIENYLTNNSLH